MEIKIFRITYHVPQHHYILLTITTRHTKRWWLFLSQFAHIHSWIFVENWNMLKDHIVEFVWISTKILLHQIERIIKIDAIIFIITIEIWITINQAIYLSTFPSQYKPILKFSRRHCNKFHNLFSLLFYYATWFKALPGKNQ